MTTDSPDPATTSDRATAATANTAGTTTTASTAYTADTASTEGAAGTADTTNTTGTPGTVSTPGTTATAGTTDTPSTAGPVEAAGTAGAAGKASGAGRAGIVLFDPPDDAPLLHETGMMSMPTMDPPATDQMMEWALSGGHVVKVLFRQGGEGGDRGGMSLVWSWFGPHYPLPRHSHDADCLYYVVAGEARMGNRTIGAGGGFFVPAGAPYAYTAGPEGIQILEFRGVSSFDMQITESLGRWDRILETVRAHKPAWEDAAPHA